MMESENVIVVVRIRPIQKSEELRGEKGCVAPISSGKEVQVRTGPLAAQVFKCNGCFPRDTSQEEFFDQSGITDLLDSAMGGYRASTFAFGQTGAGKTFTCSGPSDDGISPGHPDEGLLGRSLKYLFEKLSDLHVKFNLRISCYEIYHENVFDLFAEEKERTPLGVREHSTDGFFLVGCKLINCPSYKVACNAVGYAIQNRQVGHHDLNSHSSRSHCITEIYIDLPGQAALMSTAGARAPGLKGLQREMEAGREYMVMGRMTFVDLAGSERLKTTQSTGKVLHEAGFINRSLYVLGKVIAGLVRTGGDLNHRDVPYRDSKLTKLLIGSLGGRTRTLLMACVTEASGSQAETLRTLKFSMSCARIRNRPVRFLDPQVKLILELRGEIKRLRDENSQLRTSIQTGPSDSRTIYASGGEDGLKGDLSNGGYDDDDGDDVVYNNTNDNGSMMEYRNGHNREHTDSYHDDSRRSSQASNSTPHDRAVTHLQNKGGGGIIREGNNRKSQSLAELRADASAFANRQGGEDEGEDREGRNYHIYSNKKPSPSQKSNVVLRKQSRNIDIGDKRKAQGKAMSVSDGRQDRGMEGNNREMEIRRQQQEMEMHRQQQSNHTPPRKSSNMSYDSASHNGNRVNSIDTRTGAGGETGGGTGGGRGAGAGAGRGMSENDEYSGIGSNPSHASQGLDSGSAVDAAVGRSEPFVSAITRATSASSGYTDDGFDEYADPDEPDQEGAALTVTPHLSPKSYDEESPKGMYSRAPNKTPDSCTSYNDEIPKGMYSGAPNKIPDPYTGYPIGSEQHRIHVQRLHEEAERERRAIEDKLMRLRDVDMVRRKQKEYENMVNSQNQNQNQYVNQRQQQQQQQQQQQYQFHNNHHTNHDNNFQIMDRHTDHIRQPPQHTSSSSKSNNSNYAHERSHDRSHERYDGMIKSDSRSGKIKKLKSVIEIPRRIIKKKVNNYSAPSYTAAVPWDDRPMVEKKLERRLRDKERSDEAATRDTGSNRAPPGIASLLRGAQIIKMPPQLRGSGKGSEKDRNLPTTVTHHGSSSKNGIARSTRNRERGRGGAREGSGSDNDEAVGEEKSNRFLPYITAQPPKNGRAILSDKRRLSSDPRLHGLLGGDRGRVQAGENGRPGRQRSVSAENRISIETNMDPQGARNALRVSTSPTLHQHRTGSEEGSNNEDRSDRNAHTQMKLFLLERKLLELRQHMEDSPGDVTCEAEELISALEEEVRSMRMDLNAASASGVGSGAGAGAGADFQGPNSKGRTGPWGPGGWRDDRDRCRKGQGQGYAQGQGEDEVKETSRDKFSPRGLTDNGVNFRSPQPPTHPAGGLMRDETNPVSRKDMTAGRLNQQKKGSSYVPALRHMAQRSGSDSHDDHTHGGLLLDHINDGRVKDCPTASTLSPDTKITGDIDIDGDGDGQGYDDDAYEDDFQTPEIENKVEQKDDVSVLTSTDAGSKIMSTVLLSAQPREAHTTTSTVLDGFNKGLKGDSNSDQSTPLPASAAAAAAAAAVAPQVHPPASKPTYAPPVLRPAAKGPPSLAEIRRIKEEKLMQQEKEEKERADREPPVTVPLSVQAHVHAPSSASVTDSVSSSHQNSRGQGEELVDSRSQQHGKNENGANNQYFKVPPIQAEETGGYVPSSQARVKRNDVFKEKVIEPEREVFYGKETRKEKEKDTDEMYCPVKIKEKDKNDDDDSDDDYLYRNVKQNKDPIVVEKPSWNNSKKKENEKEKEKENERVKEQDKDKEKKTDNWNKNMKSWDVEKDKVIDRNKVDEKDYEVLKEKEKITEKEGQFKGGNYDEKIPSKKPGSFFAYGNSKTAGKDDDDEYEFNGSDDEIA